MGNHFVNPALGGGGGSEMKLSYTITPYDTITEASLAYSRADIGM